jgi:hypothetical protein
VLTLASWAWLRQHILSRIFAPTAYAQFLRTKVVKLHAAPGAFHPWRLSARRCLFKAAFVARHACLAQFPCSQGAFAQVAHRAAGAYVALTILVERA